MPCRLCLVTVLLNLGVAYEIAFIADIYVTIHKSSKIAVMKQQQNNSMVVSHHNVRNCVKGSQRWEGWEPLL